jgi:hypothetical protein
MIFNLFTKRPKLVAAFAFRYDEQLVPDLLKNIEPFIDDYVAWDDRQSGKKWTHEGELRRHLIDLASAKQPDWILIVDPDERFEKSAGNKIRKLIKTKNKIIYGFRFRELWSPEQYRVDGVWGQKIKYILFPLLPGQIFMDLHVHCQTSPQNPDYKRVVTDLNLYHLKMIDPQNRIDRVKLFNELDPSRKIQSIGYDYLADESGMVLEKIPDAKKYDPPYREDYQIRQVGNPATCK